MENYKSGWVICGSACRKEFVIQQMLAKKLQQAQLVEISSTPSFERLMSRIQTDEKQIKDRFQSN
ncbi:MAG: hypothetical protein PHG00_13445 [Methylococcales bacterium]|nr:hypothetical protein [Methylococcales bacterium]